MPKKNISKKSSIDYFEQMFQAGQPVIKKVEHKSHKSKEELREREVEDSLSEIYQDDAGRNIDVQKISVRPRRWWLKIILFLLYSAIIIAIGYLGYRYYISYQAKDDLFTVVVEADKNLTAGREFAYTISYHNKGRLALEDVEIKAEWPKSFIFRGADPATTSLNVWHIGHVPAEGSGQIVVKGILLNKIGENNQVHLTSSFRPANLSSAFVINTTYNVILTDSVLAVGISAPDVLAIGRDNEVIISYQEKEESLVDNVQLIMNDVDWAEVKLFDGDQEIQSTGNFRWTLPTPSSELKSLKLVIKPSEQESRLEILSFRLETNIGEQSYLIDSRDFDCHLVNSRLNLLLKINDSNADSGVFAGTPLNYRIDYVNQGDTTLKDVKIIASLEGAWLDWSSLKDSQQGQIKGQTIIWSKKEIPSLALLKPGASGSIHFSINVKDWQNGDKNDSGEIRSYAYYQTGDKVIEKPTDEEKSNTIINQLNSDLSLTESVVYFNEDNIAVGSGPVPMVVGETTNLKVYWRISNSLHDLRDVEVIGELPDYVDWGGKNHSSVGELSYDADSRQVKWHIDRLPANSQEVSGDFSISVTPRPDQKNQIIVVLPGSTITAIDNVTQARLEFTTQAKTSRLEDDTIVQTDGLVQ
ncbi:MAG TPA: hypothetical protein P5194_00825 [Patescibacteria group bacterium]|nr:hypothetical protein [bacterium]HRT11071.1 hypothetical protein [Patescibacteria group bacterium]HRU89770.1 hypothetical protein [Patescibacteria group bacterium]